MIIQILKHMAYLAFCELVEYAISSRRQRPVDITNLNRRDKARNEYRWN